MRKQRGFTLIELIVVVIILGILSATALPRLINIGSDARIASIKATQDAVNTGVTLAAAKCRLVTACNVSGWSVPISGPSGVTGTMYNGYPTGQSRVPSYFGIKDWVDVQGISVYETNTAVTEFRIDSAPTPSNCKVVYHQVDTFGLVPDVTSYTGGC